MEKPDLLKRGDVLECLCSDFTPAYEGDIALVLNVYQLNNAGQRWEMDFLLKGEVHYGWLADMSTPLMKALWRRL